MVKQEESYSMKLCKSLKPAAFSCYYSCSAHLTEFISLPCMQILVPGTAVTGVSHHPAEQDVESSQRTPLRAPGQPGWRVKSCTNTLQMFDFPEPHSVWGCHNISAFSLPCSTAAFLPCLFFLPPNICDFLGDPILSHT